MTQTTPQVLITRQQYLADIKVRWEIHQYETNKLIEDVKQLVDYVKPFIQQTVEYVKDSYQREFGPKTTV
ncbi:hypothetical protein [Synechococcus phage S-B05]|jgi:hypothetical protein|nr:hypothetical protein [Synechococcus phage S-B05]QCW22868.1 hypothetical protein [Synechococcus phage S-B05]QDH50719.1 hypothetical protein [Synechococcus phage S-B43]